MKGVWPHRLYKGACIGVGARPLCVGVAVVSALPLLYWSNHAQRGCIELRYVLWSSPVGDRTCASCTQSRVATYAHKCSEQLNS